MWACVASGGSLRLAAVATEKLVLKNVLKNVFQISVLSGVVYLVTLLYYVPKRKIVLFTSLDFEKHTVTPYNIYIYIYIYTVYGIRDAGTVSDS